ncbi:MAG: transcription termination factor Rho [Blautia sp.]|nr:transcription termination factor Rho [Blautia sp.]
MREKYETLSLAVLRELAKARGLKSISGLRKPELIDRMVEEDEKEAAASGSDAQDAADSGTQDVPSVSQDVTPDTEPETASPVPADAESRRPEEYRPSAQGNTRGVRESGGTYVPRGMQRTDSGMARQGQRPYRPQGGQIPPRGYAQRGYQSDPAYGRGTGEPAHSSQEGGFQEGSGQERTGRIPAQNSSAGTSYTTVPTPLDSPIPESPAEYSQEHTERLSNTYDVPVETVAQLDSGERANGILEVMPDGFGFIRCENYLPGENDIYVSPSQIRRFNLKTGDIIQGNIRIKTQGEKFSALLYVTSINGFHPSEGQKRYNFDDMTPVFPNERLRLERPGGTTAMRVVDLISPIGKGQRGMIVSPPKAGKTTLLKDVAKSILRNTTNMHLIILLIDERPEEVTDIKEAIYGPNVEVIYSTFDETPEHHRRVSEMVIERARRLVEHKKDVTILLDSITRLARAYNLVIPPSGRTLSGGLDPAALHMPKRFFGAARNMREGGSLTILATALVDTGSKMDDVIYEEFKGTGNMELVLDRKLQERRIFPAIDIQKSGTRREDLLLTREEQEAVYTMRKALNGLKSEDAAEQILNMFARTRTNAEFVQMIKKNKIV